MFFCFVFFLPIKTIILDWQDRQLLFIVSVEDFYFIFLLSGGSGEKKNQYLFSIWTISISRWHHVGLSMWYFHTILTLFLLELQIEDSVACRQLDGGHDSS